jgi:SHS2 domain-containing protein
VPYEYLENSVTSDATFRAWGRDLNELFTAAADATTNVMVGAVEPISPTVTKAASVHAEDLDLLLLRFLEEIIFHKDAEGLILRATVVHVEAANHGHQVHAQLRGEPINPGKHEILANIKAVTVHGLRVEHTDAGWRAQVTLDV